MVLLFLYRDGSVQVPCAVLRDRTIEEGAIGV